MARTPIQWVNGAVREAAAGREEHLRTYSATLGPRLGPATYYEAV